MLRTKYLDIYDLAKDIESLGSGNTRGDVVNYLIVAAKIGLICHGYTCDKEIDGNIVKVDCEYDQCVLETIEKIVGDKYKSLDINSINASHYEKAMLGMVATSLLAGSYLIIDKYEAPLYAITGVNLHDKDSSEEEVTILTESAKSYLSGTRKRKLIYLYKY